VAVLVGLVALAAFGWDLRSEPHFVDESAYYSQTYFAELFAGGRFNDPLWLDFAGYDLPPLTKYLIAPGLWAGGYRFPKPIEAMEWYRNTSARFETGESLTVARVPMVILGALGCVAVYGLGVLASGRGVGAIAALLVMVNPLYRTHARRAMSDIPCEAFMLLGLFLALWAWRRLLEGRPWPAAGLSALAAGICAGLSVLAKLSGLLTMIVIAAWVALALVVPVSVARRLRVVAVLPIAAAGLVATCLALDPFYTARPVHDLPGPVGLLKPMNPLQRARWQYQHRRELSDNQQHTFPHNALLSPREKVLTTLVQGFGRFGPFGRTVTDSTKRYDLRQDWGTLIWLPWVVAGAFWAARRGWCQSASGEPPTAWAALLHFGVAYAVVTAYIPMAWDRYELPFQAPAALLAAGAAVAVAGRFRLRSLRPGA
jgi:4-amino-4-deoxy-L-arabinose transferase-like glycosyltransferase